MQIALLDHFALLQIALLRGVSGGSRGEPREPGSTQAVTPKFTCSNEQKTGYLKICTLPGTIDFLVTVWLPPKSATGSATDFGTI